VNRREFIAALGSAAATWPIAARAQQREPTRRVGLLIAFPNDAETQGLIKAFKQALETGGWAEGRNVRFEARWVDGDAARIPALAAELVGGAPDVILAVSTPALVGLRQQTRTIPLVFVNVSDPVDGGFVGSMARPGGNVTGFTSFEYSIGGKWLDLLKEISPSLKRVLVVLNQENYTSRALLHTITALVAFEGGRGQRGSRP
jgi:putative ABC transport system substrate-binding protein